MDKFPISFEIQIDGVTRSRHSVRNEQERQEVIDANLRVYGSDHVKVIDDLVSNRRHRILDAVIEGLLEYYPCLAEESQVEAMKANVPVVIDSGNEQDDYEWAKWMIERQAKNVEKLRQPNPNDPDGLWPLVIE